MGDKFAGAAVRSALGWIPCPRTSGYDVPGLYKYEPSGRVMPDALPELEYPGHYEVRYLSKDGNVRFKSKQFFVSQTLAHEHVGFEEVADGVWDLYFFDRFLARLDERTWKLMA